MWHPLIASIKLTGEGVSQLRTIELIDGKQIIERLETMDNSQRLYRYTNVSGIGAVDYTGTLDVKPKGSGSSVEWRVQFLADNQPTLIVATIVSTLLSKLRLRSPQEAVWSLGMIAEPEIDLRYPLTDGNIAANNLESARQQSWSRFWQDPQRAGIAEYIVEQEQFTAQYVGDLGALERLDALVRHLNRVGADGMRTALIHAQVASMGHRFAEAREYLAQAEAHGALQADVNRLRLRVSTGPAAQAFQRSVLEVRRKMASGAPSDWKT